MLPGWWFVPPTPSSTAGRAVHGLILVGAAFSCAILYLFDPTSSTFYPVCPFRAMTGAYCPGCGSLRALHALSHGRLSVALSHNVLTILFVPIGVYIGISSSLILLRGIGMPVIHVPAKAIWALLAVVMAFAIARNIPVEPWSGLAP